MPFKSEFPIIPRLFRRAALICALPALLFSAPTSQVNLAEQARNAESQGYYNLAAHYYYHALKQYPGNAAMQAGFDRCMEKRRVERIAGAPKVEPGPKSEVPLAHGQAAWIEGDARTAAKAINDYNLASPRSQRIKYVFPEAGSLSIADGRLSLEFSPDRCLIVADTLLGEGRAYPVITGSSKGAAQVSPQEWDRVAKDLCAKLAAEDRFSGLVLDLQPHDPALHAFYAALKKNTAKPLGVILSSWDKSTFRFADLIILRALESSSAARDQIHGFLADARSESGTALVSLPSSPAAFEADRQSLALSVVDDDPAYLGMGATIPADAKVLELLKTPLERQ